MKCKGLSLEGNAGRVACNFFRGRESENMENFWLIINYESHSLAFSKILTSFYFLAFFSFSPNFKIPALFPSFIQIFLIEYCNMSVFSRTRCLLATFFMPTCHHQWMFLDMGPFSLDFIIIVFLYVLFSFRSPDSLSFLSLFHRSYFIWPIWSR